MNTKPLIVTLTLASLAFPARAATEPAPQPAEIETLKLAKSGSGIQLTRTSGASPFAVGRDGLADFSQSASLVVTGGISPATYFDSGVLLTAQNHFYLLSDAAAVPQVFSVSPASPAVGDTVTMLGLGLTGASVVDAADTPITLASSSDTALTFTVPTAGGLTAGPITISTSYGSKVTDPIPVTLHKTGVSGLGTPGHIAYDAVNIQVLYANFENTTAKMFSYKPATGATATFGTTWPKWPTGFAIGPYNGSGRYLFVTANVKTTGALTNGNILAYDLITGVRTTVGPMTNDTTNDSVDSRALAIGPDPYGAAGYVVHALTLSTPSFGSLVRFLKLDNTFPMPLGTDWLSITATGDIVNQNFPGGLAVTTARGYYFTTGGAAGNVEFWKPITPPSSPIGHQRAFTSAPAVHFINNPAGIAIESATGSATQSLWVANRGAVGTGSLVKLNVANDGANARVTPTAIELYKGIINDPRGVAVQYDNVFGGGSQYSKFLWVTTADGLQAWRALRQVKLKIFMANHAGDAFTNLPAAGNAELTRWAQRAAAYAKGIYQTVGIDILWDGNITWLDDELSVVNPLPRHQVAYRTSLLDSSCGPMIANWTPQMDQYAINMILVHGIRDYHKQPDGTLLNKIGWAALNSRLSCSGKIYAIGLMSYGTDFMAALQQPSNRVSPAMMSHEMGHLILTYGLSGLPYDTDGHLPDPKHLMFYQDNGNAKKWTYQDSTIINAPANNLNPLILPEGGIP